MAKEFSVDLGVVPLVLSAITLYCDNSEAVAQERKAHREKVPSHS